MVKPAQLLQYLGRKVGSCYANTTIYFFKFVYIHEARVHGYGLNLVFVGLFIC